MENTSKKKDLVTYDVYELDILELKRQLEVLRPDKVAVYGIGNNGIIVSRVLRLLGIKIKCFVDVKAMGDVKRCGNHSVVTPKEFIENYKDEYIIISPSIHDEIVDWFLKSGIKREKMITAFYKTEQVTIDYGKYDESSLYELNNHEEEETPRATFVTIAYNTPENLLRRAIESVINQTEKRLKYLFILNGPTDNTAKVIRDYAKIDKRICVVDLGTNLPWTDVKLLKTIKDNLAGDYCCQLDSDDYYNENFLSETLNIGDSNNADIVGVRTCLFANDKSYNPMLNGLEYDWHDVFFFNVVHPACHIIGNHNIMKSYVKSKICSTFWGKLYRNDLMNKYLDYLLKLSKEDRELYYRLDIAMTYRILSMAERFFYSDKVLHFSQYSKKNSTFTLAPIEWLMSLWYAYKNLAEEMTFVCKRKEYSKEMKGFLNVHLLWMVARRGMLKEPEKWKNKAEIIENFREMIKDPIFCRVLKRRSQYMRNECLEFYERIAELASQGE